MFEVNPSYWQVSLEDGPKMTPIDTVYILLVETRPVNVRMSRVLSDMSDLT